MIYRDEQRRERRELADQLPAATRKRYRRLKSQQWCNVLAVFICSAKGRRNEWDTPEGPSVTISPSLLRGAATCCGAAPRAWI